MAKGGARDLFDDGDGDIGGRIEAEIVVNKAYAGRFEHNKRREDLHRLQELEKRGMASLGEDDSETEEEDDDGILPSKTEAKILETLMKIKRKDPSIYAGSTKFFDEEDEEDDGDGEEEREAERERAKKPVYLKDAMAKQLLEDGPEMAEDGDEKKPKKRGKTYLEEQEGLKQAFLREAAAAMESIDGKKGSKKDSKKDKKKNRKKDGDEDEDGGEEEDDEESGGLLRLRKRSKSDGEIPSTGNGKEDGKGEEDDSVIAKRLEEYFGVDNGLDESEKFLKSFLLNKGWVDPESNRNPSYEDIIGDEEELLRQEKFEADYNFRFEEGPSSHVVAGYSRRIEDSVRKKPDARKKQRQSKKERMEEEELERREELKRLKNIKKSELLEKLERIRTIAGARIEDSNPLTVIIEEDLEEDFDPEEYDRKMKEAFGEEYYAAKDVDAHFGEALEEDLETLEKPDFDKEDELLGLPKDSDLLGGLVGGSGFSSVRQKLKAARKSKIGEEEEEEEEEKEEEEEEEEEDINDNSDSAQEQQSSDEEVDNTPHRKKSSSKRKKKGRISLREKLALDKELEEYYKLDYEDTIGGMPTRFKYRPVTANSYGLSAEQILKLGDTELNQYVSVKKLAPYRTEEWVPRKRHYFNNTQTHPIVLSQKKRKKRALQITASEKKSTESKDDSMNLNGTTNETMDIDEEKSGKKKRKRRKKGLGMSRERLIAYGKITPSKK